MVILGAGSGSIGKLWASNMAKVYLSMNAVDTAGNVCGYSFLT
jgi:hypothetical protein